MPALPLAIVADASTIFYVSLLVVFITAIITTIATKWSRDKCLKFFDGYRTTLERARGHTIWGRLKVFSSGIEVMYDHAYVDHRGRLKTSFMIYQNELEQQVLSLIRYHDQLDPKAQRRRLRQVRITFNPGFVRRSYRTVRNVVNTLRDAINTALGAAVSEYSRANPHAAVLSTQQGAITNVGQTLIGKFANAYEPLLEQYIGRPVILDVADPINPNNATQEYTGYLADYTQQFIAVFSVEHLTADEVRIALPDVDQGEGLPPLPAPPPAGAPPIVMPPPLVIENGIAVRIDGLRLKIQNTRAEALAVGRLEKPGMQPLALDMILPPMGTLDLPARDARGATLVCRVVRSLDVVAPRKFAIVRHAGKLLERQSLFEELQIEKLPLVAKLFGDAEESALAQEKERSQSTPGNPPH